MTHRSWPFLCLVALLGCDYDPEWDRDYRDDPETDLEEDAAQEALVDRLDELDDLDPIPADLLGAPRPRTGTRPQGLTRVASTGPTSIMQDDIGFTGFTEIPGRRTDPCQRPAEYGDYDAAQSRQAMLQAKAMGVDVIRVMIYWKDVVPGNPCDTAKPGYPFQSSKEESGYDWRPYDIAIRNAADPEINLKILFTVSAPLPFWASEEPAYCDKKNQQGRLQPKPGWTGGDANCTWKPDPIEYGRFVTAVGRHFKTLPIEQQQAIFGWTLWNEPNIAGFLSDGRLRGDGVEYSAFMAGMRYRKMYLTGFKALRKTAHIPGRVFFGDHANGLFQRPGCCNAKTCAKDDQFKCDRAGKLDPDSDRWDVLWHALCLPSKAHTKVESWERELSAKELRTSCPAEEPKDPWCARKNRWIHASGLAFHPYSPTPSVAKDAVLFVRDGLIRPAAAACRLKNESRAGLRRDRIYLTEFAFLAAGASRNFGGTDPVSLADQPTYIELTERAMHEVGARTVAQYQLYDEGRGSFDSGLRFSSMHLADLLGNGLGQVEVKQGDVSCTIPTYIQWVAQAFGIPIALDINRPDANAPPTCTPRYDAFKLRWEGPDPEGATEEDVRREWTRRCEQPEGLLRCAKKPAYDAYVMPVVLGKAQNGQADLFVLSRAAAGNPMVLEGWRPAPNDATPVAVGGDAIKMETDKSGYARCPAPMDQGGFARCVIPVEDFTRIRVSDALTGEQRERLVQR